MALITFRHGLDHSIPSPPHNIGQAAAGVISYVDEFQRLLTFPYIWNGTARKIFIAREGFYFFGGVLRCAFCPEVLNINSEIEILTLHRETCHMIGNIELQNFTQNFRYELNRLMTFLVIDNWDCPLSPEELAKDGFYSTGTADNVRCFVCRLEIRQWEQGDTARGEHLRFNPNCPFIRGISMGNVPLDLSGNLENVFQGLDFTANIANVIAHGTNEPELDVHYLEGVPHENEEVLGVIRKVKARHPQFDTFSARFDTFNMWPAVLKQRPKELALAGFYYTNKGDRVICFQCGGGLKDWGPHDEPWKEHALWFSQCPFLILAKGRDFIMNIVEKKNQQTEECIDDNTTAPFAVDSGSTPIEQETKNSEENTYGLEFEDMSRKCKYCKERDIGVVLLPCGHMASCPECIIGKKNCPICKKDINAYVRAYIS